MRPLMSSGQRDDRGLQVVEEDLPDLFEMVETSMVETHVVEPSFVENTGEWQQYDSVETEEVFAEQLSEMIAHSLIDEF